MKQIAEDTSLFFHFWERTIRGKWSQVTRIVGSFLWMLLVIGWKGKGGHAGERNLRTNDQTRRTQLPSFLISGPPYVS